MILNVIIDSNLVICHIDTNLGNMDTNIGNIDSNLDYIDPDICLI